MAAAKKCAVIMYPRNQGWDDKVKSSMGLVETNGAQDEHRQWPHSRNAQGVIRIKKIKAVEMGKREEASRQTNVRGSNI